MRHTAQNVVIMTTNLGYAASILWRFVPHGVQVGQTPRLLEVTVLRWQRRVYTLR